MKFVHMADMHFDAPFIELSSNKEILINRRLQQRKAFKDIVEYIKKNNIKYFFIAGDLYEQKYIQKSTIEFINELFKSIPDTKIFITPGNHDPYIKNSFYNQFNWNENVHIFTSRLEKIETNEVDIYGYGFDDFYMKNTYDNINIDNPDKINILITHGSLDSSKVEERLYNPLSSKILKDVGFDYIALGHVHKKSFNDYKGQNIVYPGSTFSMGFDELGDRGIIVGDVDKNKLELEFLKIDSKTFEEFNLDITDILSKEELIENINKLELNTNSFYKIILTGKRNFEIDIMELKKFINNENVLKIKNNTDIKYDIEEVSKEVTLKGIFARKILDKINKAIDEEEKNKLLEAFEEGMNVLNK